MGSYLGVAPRDPIGHLARLRRETLCFNGDPVQETVAVARMILPGILAARPELERKSAVDLRAAIRARVQPTLWTASDYWNGPEEIEDVTDAVWSDMLARRLGGEITATQLATLTAPWQSVVERKPVATDWAGPHTLAIEQLVEQAAHLDRERAAAMATARAAQLGIEDARRELYGSTPVPADRRAGGILAGDLANTAVRLALVEPGTRATSVENGAAIAADDAATAVAWSDLIPVDLFDRLLAAWRAGQPAAVRVP